MKNTQRPILITAIVIMAILGIAVFTKPEDKKCKDIAETEVMKQIKGNMPDDAFKYQLVQNLAAGAVSYGVRVNDKYFYKEITFTSKGKTRTVGYGLFGMVHIKKD